MSHKAILCYICSWSLESLFVYSCWWFSPWELWGYWLVHIVVPRKGLQTPLAPWVLSLAPSLETDYEMDIQVGQSLDGPSFHLSSKLCLCTSFHGYFVRYSKEE